MKEPIPEGLSISPYCIDLRSKKAFFLGRQPMTEDDLLDASQHCWCKHTMQAVGPDGDVVRPADCGADRSCFRSIL